jgi:hypothetical protein
VLYSLIIGHQGQKHQIIDAGRCGTHPTALGNLCLFPIIEDVFVIDVVSMVIKPEPCQGKTSKRFLSNHGPHEVNVPPIVQKMTMNYSDGVSMSPVALHARVEV